MHYISHSDYLLHQTPLAVYYVYFRAEAIAHTTFLRWDCCFSLINRRWEWRCGWRKVGMVVLYNTHLCVWPQRPHFSVNVQLSVTFVDVYRYSCSPPYRNTCIIVQLTSNATYYVLQSMLLFFHSEGPVGLHWTMWLFLWHTVRWTWLWVQCRSSTALRAHWLTLHTVVLIVLSRILHENSLI